MALSEKTKAAQSSGVPVGTIVAFGLDAENVPDNWQLCDGSRIGANTPLAQYMTNTPNLCGRTLVGANTTAVPGGYTLGGTGGEEAVTLDIAHIPPHNHVFFLPQGDQNWGNGGGNTFWGPSPGMLIPTSETGGGLAHDNMQPYYVVNYIIYVGAF